MQLSEQHTAGIGQNIKQNHFLNDEKKKYVKSNTVSSKIGK
jgi:hypothetical protein